jgi:SPP1 gp7 family putative phage head morphogenesis protein
VWKHYRQIGSIVQSIISFHTKADGTIDDTDKLLEDLTQYSESLGTWANTYWSKLLQRQAKALSADFKRQGLSIDLQSPMFRAKIRQMLDEQVTLIKTLPLNAAKVAQDYASKAAQETGERHESLIRKLQGLEPGYPEYAARRLARTEVAKTQSLIVQAQAESLGIKQYIWRSAEDEDVRESHQLMNGKICSFDDPPEVEPGKRYHAGQIYNCFPADTVVEVPKDLKKIIRASFDGDVVDICTSFTRVTATANHPVLTQRGWVKCSELREGDYLLKLLGDAVEMIEADEDKRFSTFGDLFRSFLGHVESPSGDVLLDLYGDAVDNKIDVATLGDFDLLKHFQPEAFKSFGDLKLTRPAAVVGGVVCDAEHVRLAGIGRKSLSVFEGSAGHANVHRLAAVAGSEICLFQALDDGSSGNAEVTGDTENAFACMIPLDNLALIEHQKVRIGDAVPNLDAHSSEFEAENIGRDFDLRGGVLDGVAALYQGFRIEKLVFRKFSGHVFTFETKKGWYGVTPLSIIAKNCRCYMEPLLPSDDKE